MQTNQCVPYLEWHMPKTRTTKAIQIICSGGTSYEQPDGFEVAPTRRFLNEKGHDRRDDGEYRTPRPSGGLAKHTTA